MDTGFFKRILLKFGIREKDVEVGEFYNIMEYMERALQNDKELIAKLTEHDINRITAVC